MLTPTRLTAWLAFTRIAAAQTRTQAALLHSEGQSRVLRERLQLLLAVGLVVQNHVTSTAPDVRTHRCESHTWVDELLVFDQYPKSNGWRIVAYLTVAVELEVLVRTKSCAFCFCLFLLFLCWGRFDALSYVAEDLAGAEHAIGVEAVVAGHH
jgi:hypothetical protein